MWKTWGNLWLKKIEETQILISKNISFWKTFPAKTCLREILKTNISNITTMIKSMSPSHCSSFQLTSQTEFSNCSPLHLLLFLGFTQIFICLLIPRDRMTLFFIFIFFILILSNIIKNYLRSKVTLWMSRLFFFP